MFFLAPLLLLAATARATVLTLQSPRFTIIASDGSQTRSEPYDPRLFLEKLTRTPVTDFPLRRNLRRP